MVTTGWIKVPCLNTLLKVTGSGKRLHILTYNSKDPDRPYPHSIMWAHSSRIIKLHYHSEHQSLYSLSEDRTLKVWQWMTKHNRFDHIGTINHVDDYVLSSTVLGALLEVRHKNGITYAYGHVEEVITRITPDMWRSNTHHLFPSEMRDQIDTFWEIWNDRETLLAELPPELVVCICSFMASGRSGF